MRFYEPDSQAANVMAFYELKPQFANVKSFYKKARIKRIGSDIQLISYATHVAGVKNGKPYVKGFYSATTLRHIKEFFQQMGYNVNSKKDIEALCC